MVDKDLLSLQEARSLVRGAREAQAYLSQLSQEQVDDLIRAVAENGMKHAEALAKMAVEETGFGKWEDKRAKNLLATRDLLANILPMKTIGIVHEDPAKKMLEIATPAGVVAALVPSTNPTSTTLYKSLIALKAGNAIVISPHPSALRCISKTIEVIQEALQAQGAPADLVNMMSIPTIQGTGELMRQADLILATGGPAMVKAAYSSGTPALGVGAGNVPAFIERSANIKEAISKIMASKTFDNGTVCASEQSIVTEAVIEAQVAREFVCQGGYFLTEEQVARVRPIMERADGSMNPAIVGRDAQYLADLAKIEIPAGTKVLAYREKGVGRQYPFSKEKLTALIGFYVVETWEDACELCHALLKNGGIGHSLALHSQDEAVIREFALRKPVSRLLVNTPSTQGAVGISTNLPPSFTLGCGTVGGSSTSDNVGPMHLLNLRHLAYDTGAYCPAVPSACAAPQEQELEDEVKRITELVLAQLANK
ncbi:acetaldehyde dehydrogenase (acetylating) [Desulfobulbus rhabdoformis]|uniref:acetaldehyde dehydrogenase (acetylating) n=1 Tax=Desulfobulbus rhabdoformis TaxID=34032 RepID=UPI00196329F2|nr:acetaldehyde dehydrogenase (acetylating) [Desulfobulbus rhabdoformis]MBM9613748.1 acetaldehyde dehydrogenase (acetylating) [Desulfobulbus rhabdoformis]